MSIYFGIICRLCMRHSNSMIPLFDDNCSTLSKKIMMLIPALKKFEISSDIFICEGKKLENNSKNEENEIRLAPDIEEKIITGEFHCDLTELKPDIKVTVSAEREHGDNTSLIEISCDTKPKKSSITLKNMSLPCHVCGKLVVKKRLNEHVRRHTIGRPFNCEECGKTFIDRSSLIKHSVIHSGLRAHMCDICGKSFKHLGHLKTHHLTHTGQKLYVCDVCGKSFSQIGNLKNHELLHTGEKQFGCNLCGKRFTEKRTLQIHVATHTGDKDHVCEICGKVFLLKGYLNKHLVVHSGVKKFSCEICGLSYTQGHSLRKHKIKHSIS